MRACDLMSTPVHTVRRSTTVAQAAALLTRFSITALPVLDGADRLIGMVAESDLLWHRVPASPDAHLWRHPDHGVDDPPGTVGDVMSAPAVALSPGSDAAGVAEVLVGLGFASVPIVDGSTVVGIVSRQDLLHALVRRDEALAAEARHLLDEYGAGLRRWEVYVEDGVATVIGAFTAADERAVQVLVGTLPEIRTVQLRAADARAARTGAEATRAGTCVRLRGECRFERRREGATRPGRRASGEHPDARMPRSGVADRGTGRAASGGAAAGTVHPPDVRSDDGGRDRPQ